jgi:hypothetical protein
MKILYHITTVERAKRIVAEGFKNKLAQESSRHFDRSLVIDEYETGRIFFSKPETLRLWTVIMENELRTNDLAAVKLQVTDGMYEREFLDYDVHGAGRWIEGQVTYGEGKVGFLLLSELRPRLTPNLLGVKSLTVLAGSSLATELQKLKPIEKTSHGETGNSQTGEKILF